MLYKVTYKLEGILIFSTEVRPMISRGNPMGSYISPLPYIHNYPIIYAINGKSCEAYFVFPSLHESYYEERKHKGEKLNYTTVKEILDNAKKGIGFYPFPLIPKKIVTSSFLMSAESWSYGLLTRSPTKNVFPRLTSYTAFMPESEFVSYLVTDGKFQIPEWIRIGKKRWGIMKINAQPLEIKKVNELQQCVTSFPINVNDAEYFGYKVISYSKLLETPSLEEGIIGWANLEKCLEIVTKYERITLPIPKPFLPEV
ncbi:type I-D CRISPR-associated protein Csc1 [Sulfolobus sp. E5-1-F]|uniref:type I-D CRISPR-associated protein Csc1 n=1 Tax=Saccharolobus sp. E5-1-F TaxID=2663019 RepID=UPI00129758D1|nr:type I-D CRISPR-associated protein Csc1 [Sulfolobus sp. E5-1-F]QGA53943.1 type I-D CRISPR-associated protein Csc1 [Sulfolobus sp. E5-1-F]